MNEIVNHIDSWINSTYGNLSLKNYGYSELTNRTSKGNDNTTSQPIPITIPDRNQVSLDNDFDVVIWTRLPGRINITKNDELSFGRKDARQQSAGLRIIVAHKVTLGEDFIIGFSRDFPEFFTISGYEYVFVGDTIDVDADHESVYTTELGNTVYEKHRFTWNIYAVQVNLDFVKCV